MKATVTAVHELMFRRERGAKALEERLEMKRIAEAPIVESAAATAASGLPTSGNGVHST